MLAPTKSDFHLVASRGDRGKQGSFEVVPDPDPGSFSLGIDCHWCVLAWGNTIKKRGRVAHIAEYRSLSVAQGSILSPSIKKSQYLGSEGGQVHFSDSG